MNFKLKSLLIFALMLSIASKAQLVTTNTLTPQQLVQQVLLGAGVTASNITFSGDTKQRVKFSSTAATNIGLLNGVLVMG
jgi:hypothetical protein